MCVHGCHQPPHPRRCRRYFDAIIIKIKTLTTATTTCQFEIALYIFFFLAFSSNFSLFLLRLMSVTSNKTEWFKWSVQKNGNETSFVRLVFYSLLLFGVVRFIWVPVQLSTMSRSQEWIQKKIIMLKWTNFAIPAPPVRIAIKQTTFFSSASPVYWPLQQLQ